jgi:DNA-binding NtrC family response regulator
MLIKKRVLIVDDEADILVILRTLLKKNKFEVLEASSADCALNLLENESVDLIISDIVMPGMNGRDFVKEVRQWDMNMPVIFISGKDTISKKDLSHISAFIEKPFSKDTLLKTIHKVLSNQT